MLQLTLLIVPTMFVLLLAVTALVHLFYFVPYVPSKTRVVQSMVKLAKLKNGETVFDLGCGDGRILFAAESQAKKIKAYGYELAPLVYLLARLRALINRSRAEIYLKSFFAADLKKADVIFCYLLPHVMPRLLKKIQAECKKGTRIISHTFQIEGVPLTKRQPRNKAKKIPSLYLYTL